MARDIDAVDYAVSKSVERREAVQHSHSEYVEGCYRCEIARNEVEPVPYEGVSWMCVGCGHRNPWWHDDCMVCKSPQPDDREHLDTGGEG